MPAEQEQTGRPNQPSPGRLEAFSDGVIAVIITIMVLEFKVPHTDGFAGLLPVWPTFAVYLLSFAYTGLYWINHHHTIHRLKRVDAAILYANLLLLFFLSLLPFFTANMVDKHFTPFSVQVYAAELLASALSFSVMNFAVERNVCRGGRTEEWHQVLAQRAGRRKALVTELVYALAVVVAARFPAVALGLIALITLIWVVPGFAVREPATSAPDEPKPDAPHI